MRDLIRRDPKAGWAIAHPVPGPLLLGEGTNNFFTLIFRSYNFGIVKSSVKSIFWIHLSIQRSVLEYITPVWLSLQVFGFRNGCFPI